MGNTSARSLFTLLILAAIPLLLAITINSPAKARVPEMGDVPPAEVAEISDPEFEVTLDTGSIVVGYESRISAIAITATQDD